MATTARLAMATPVGEIAFGPALTVRETDSARYALGLMAHRKANVVTVLDDLGTPRGVLRDADLLRSPALRSEG
jgi:CBS domain-containing protein